MNSVRSCEDPPYRLNSDLHSLYLFLDDLAIAEPRLHEESRLQNTAGSKGEEIKGGGPMIITSMSGSATDIHQNGK